MRIEKKLFFEWAFNASLGFELIKVEVEDLRKVEIFGTSFEKRKTIFLDFSNFSGYDRLRLVTTTGNKKMTCLLYIRAIKTCFARSFSNVHLPLL